jgi:hypothetical protein
MYTTKDILECAYDIRSALPHLLSDQALQVEQELTALLTRATAGEKTDVLILHLLSQHPPTKEWARRYLRGDQEGEWIDPNRNYSTPPGASEPVPVAGVRYFCPWCGFRWIRREAGQQPPALCPNDNKTPLQPVTTQVRRPDAR